MQAGMVPRTNRGLPEAYRLKLHLGPEPGPCSCWAADRSRRSELQIEDTPWLQRVGQILSVQPRGDACSTCVSAEQRLNIPRCRFHSPTVISQLRETSSKRI